MFSFVDNHATLKVAIRGSLKLMEDGLWWQIGLRWRSEKELISGKGEII